ncbi:hypothetical protein MTBUT4_170020 [Magnetospirillum sp. UT-4]|nr:hypothetical protein MTBUT4_170020 [Magnetospirillum sp. UT-4]
MFEFTSETSDIGTHCGSEHTPFPLAPENHAEPFLQSHLNGPHLPDSRSCVRRGISDAIDEDRVLRRTNRICGQTGSSLFRRHLILGTPKHLVYVDRRFQPRRRDEECETGPVRIASGEDATIIGPSQSNHGRALACNRVALRFRLGSARGNDKQFHGAAVSTDRNQARQGRVPGQALHAIQKDGG